MYKITITKSFSAAHVLQEIGGKCEYQHGHNFKVDVTVSAARLNDEDLLVDFRVLKGWTARVMEELDHKYLNELSPFEGVNPSSERVARYIFERIEESARPLNLRVEEVVVWESDTSRVAYTGEGR